LKRCWIGAFATVLVLVSGCEARYRSVPDELVGTNCVLLDAMRAHGVSRKLHRDQATNYVSIWNPGFTGPEVTFVTVLPAGTRMRVASALKCYNCPIEALREYRVAVIPEPEEFAGKPAYLRASSVTPSQVRCAAGSPD